MYEHVQQADQREIVALMPSEVTADFVATTLAAHGVTAVSVHCFGYPSVDFAQGVSVTVAIEQVGEAREVLRALGGVDPDDLAEQALADPEG